MIRLNSLNEIDNFIEKTEMSLIYVSSKFETCSVCHMLLPKIQETLKEYKKLTIAYVDISDVKELVGKLSVFSVPLIVIYVRGKEIFRDGRFISMNKLKEIIERYEKLI